MRQRAKQAGNLSSTPQENVKTEGQTIVIEPTSPEVVYVPQYDPWLAYGYAIAPFPGWYSYPGLYFAGPGIDTDDLLSPTDTSDATKITYLSPVLGGLQAGVSYTPQSDDEAQSVVGFKVVDPDADENLYRDLVERRGVPAEAAE